MRRIISSTFVSLDGIMQAPGGPDEDRSGGFAHGGWTEPLIDEVRVLVFPLLLGTGKRLFADGAVPTGLSLTAHAVSPSGVVMAAYHRGGPVTTGSFADEVPSAAELDRRRRLQEEERAGGGTP